VQAWMVSQAPVTQHAFLQSTPKVHSGFHAAWHVSGLKAAVTQLIKDKIPAEQALHMTAFLTGACSPWQTYTCTPAYTVGYAEQSLYVTAFLTDACTLAQRQMLAQAVLQSCISRVCAFVQGASLYMHKEACMWITLPPCIQQHMILSLDSLCIHQPACLPVCLFSSCAVCVTACISPSVYAVRAHRMSWLQATALEEPWPIWQQWTLPTLWSGLLSKCTPLEHPGLATMLMPRCTTSWCPTPGASSTTG